MSMKQDSARQSAANRARIRRLREQYHRRLVAAIILCLILGFAAGALAFRWYANRAPRDDAQAPQVAAEATPTPAPTDAWSEEPGLFLEDDLDAEVDDAAVQDAFPEVEAESEDDGATGADEPAIFPEDEPEAEATPEPAVSSDAAAEFDPAEAEVPEEYLTLEDESGEAEAEVANDEGEAADAESADAEAETGDTEPADAESADAANEAEAGETEPADAEAEVAETEPAEADAESTEAGAEAGETEPADAGAADAATEPVLPGEPQVIAIVPYGESFTYTTQIDANGNARVEAGDEPYETLSFTQTMKSYMRPTDFADQYSKTYKLAGDEAGAGFELILNDYTGAATVIPQNVIDFSLRSESGKTTERGYQLMDAPIDGNYGVALATNTPKTLYKRFAFSNAREEMAYLVVTTYNDGVSQMILFQLESDEPEPEPEEVYTILQRGIVSDEVANMQARLIDLGYLTGAADGSFGAMTEEAIKKAQEAFGLEVNGIADAQFQKKLFEGAERTPTPGAYETLREGSTGEAVVNLQLRLRELGYYGGRADGGYGPMTVAAVKKAQAAFGFEQTGIADPAFQAKAFEGAEPTPTPQPEQTPTPDTAPDNVDGENTEG